MSLPPLTRRTRLWQWARVTACTIAPALLVAQAANSRITAGNRLAAERNLVAALAQYERVLAGAPTHYEALWRAAGAAAELGERNTNATERRALFTQARSYAERAIAANPRGAHGHFQLARTLGRIALGAGMRERVRLAMAVRTHAVEALARDSTHDGAMHVLGMWHAEVMRLSGFQRTMAKAFLGGKVMGEANWPAAVRYLEAAVARAPERIVHRLDLGRIYLDLKRREAARAQFEWIARAPITDYNDASYKRLAADALRGIK